MTANIASHRSLPRGFHDADPVRTLVTQALRRRWFDSCALFGYRAVEIPPVGFAETFTMGHHAAGDRTYEFPDRRGRRLALVSDSLPAALRLAASSNASEGRLSYCCPVFRYERRPRRYFHHLGLMDVSRRPVRGLWADASLLRIGTVVTAFLADLVPLEITISSPGLWHLLAAQFPEADQTTLVNELRIADPHHRAALLQDRGAAPALLALADLIAADPAVRELPRPDSSVTWIAANDAVRACHELASRLAEAGCEVRVDLGLLHASEFHDSTALLFRSARDHQVLGDGGSYGLFGRAFLLEDLGVQCAVVGLERIADIVSESRQPTAAAAEFAVLMHGASRLADVVCADLRMAGISVWDQVISRPLSHHLRDLAELGIPASTIIGERERAGHPLQVRSADGTIVAVPLEELPSWLIARRAKGCAR